MAVQERQDAGSSRRPRGTRALAQRRTLGTALRRGPSQRSTAIAGLDASAIATGLGWFSIGLGLAELTASRAVANLIGTPDDERNCRVLQAFGIREVISGIGILTRHRPTTWLWSRVAGDAMDLAYLGAQMAAEDTNKERLAAAAGAVAVVTILDVLTSQKLSEDGYQTQSEHGMLSDWTGAAGDDVAQRRVHVVRSIPVNKPVDEVYQFWRNFENFPRFMYHLEEVRTEGDRRSHWKAKAPLGRTVEWDAEITEDRAGERICWRSLAGADVTNSGNVTFRKAPGDRGTYVTIELGYDPPGGVVGATIAKLFGREPAQQVDQDLRRFKAVLETGEVIQSDATAKGWGAARPPTPPHRR